MVKYKLCDLEGDGARWQWDNVQTAWKSVQDDPNHYITKKDWSQNPVHMCSQVLTCWQWHDLTSRGCTGNFDLGTRWAWCKIFVNICLHVQPPVFSSDQFRTSWNSVHEIKVAEKEEPGDLVRIQAFSGSDLLQIFVVYEYSAEVWSALQPMSSLLQ